MATSQKWIITGASRGLGRHLAQQAAAKGHQVLACARDFDRLQQLAALYPAGQILPCRIDLESSASITPSLQQGVAQMGGVDILINNAGVGSYQSFDSLSVDAIVQQIQVNLTAAILSSHAVLPTLQAQGHGHIINIGSDLGRRPLANMAVYAAAKHGITGFSHSLLREIKGQGIKVSLVNPGIIDTDFGGAQEGSKEAAWSLQPAALAQLIIQLAEHAGSMLVDELSVHPLGQGDF